MKHSTEDNRGFILVTMLLMIGILSTLLAAHFTTTKLELAQTKSSKGSAVGFFAAEAGLNLRAASLRTIFVDYNQPTGTSPTTSNPCVGSNQGSGDFACESITFGGRDVTTYVIADANNPFYITVPDGERYEKHIVEEYRYTVYSTAYNNQGRVEAVLGLKFKSRLVPLFQFAAFANKDLELTLGNYSNDVEGPVHANNGDLYLDAQGFLDIESQTSAAGEIYRGVKYTNGCTSGNKVAIDDPKKSKYFFSGCSSRVDPSETDLKPWNGAVMKGVKPLVVPDMSILDLSVTGELFSHADLILILRLDASGNPITTRSPSGIEVFSRAGAFEPVHTANLNTCTGLISGKPVGYSTTMYNFREATNMMLMEVDMRGLLDCIHLKKLMGTVPGGAPKELNNFSDGGLVFYFSVLGSDSFAASNNYGVRLRNGGLLTSTIPSAPTPWGVTVASDQALYILGDYNSGTPFTLGGGDDDDDDGGHGPSLSTAGLYADSINVLSNNWNDANSAQPIGFRTATPTYINAALLAGTDTTGGAEGSAGQDGGIGTYAGHFLDNMMRLHENWSGKKLTFIGSLVSLAKPRHVTGSFANQSFVEPKFYWNYDRDLDQGDDDDDSGHGDDDDDNDDGENPPEILRGVYLRQTLFVRDFEQN